MSSRAIRVLRGDAAGIILSAAANNESDDDDDDESEEEEARTYRPTAFAILNDDGEDSDDSLAVALDSLAAGNPRKEAPTNGEGDHLTEMIARDEDFDAILSEFHANDTSLKMINDSTRPDNSLASPFTKLLESLDARDFDYNLSMRNSMLHNRETASSLMRNKKNPLFGPPVDGWGKPPRFVGGGIGMVNYNDVEEGDASSHVIPWPYSSSAEKVDISTEQQHWCTFTHSNSFQRDLQDYAVIQESGDLDALVMFVAHHPYVTAALLQLSNVCYQTNHNPEGLSFLRRCLWVFESSALASFQARILQSKVVLMDMTKPENAEFFQGLFRLIQISHITGYVYASSKTRRRTFLMLNFLIVSVCVGLHFLFPGSFCRWILCAIQCIFCCLSIATAWEWFVELCLRSKFSYYSG